MTQSTIDLFFCKRVNKWQLYSIFGRKDMAINSYKHFALF